MLRKAQQNETLAGDAPEIGQRERNKRDKLLRIKNAARDLFISKGYDDTTTREIAIRAGVGMGTVFTYADNKRDLLFLIANEDLAEATRRAQADISPRGSMLSNLLTIFRDHYEYFAQQPELSRLMLREMLFYDSGEQANRFKATREHLISLICERVQLAQARNEINTAQDHQLVGWVIFSLYQVEIRRWLTGKTQNIAAGMAELERALRLVMTGIAPGENSDSRVAAKARKPATVKK